MRPSFIALFAALLSALWLPSSASANPQQVRMKHCHAEARAQGLAKDARKAFMSRCLKGLAGTAAGAAEGAVAGRPALSAGAGETNTVLIVPPAAYPPPAPARPRAGGSDGAGAAAQAPAGADHLARARRCNQLATEQGLKGALRKAFTSGCNAD